MESATTAPTTATETQSLASTPAPAAPAAAASEQTIPLSAMADRLAQKERAILRDLGVKDADEAKALLAEAKKLKAEKLTDDEKLKARIAELESAGKERDDYKATIDVQAAEAMSGLTPEQLAAVAAIAGESSAKQLRTIAALRPTWATALGVAAKPALAAAGSTTTAAAAPAPATPSANNMLATYEDLSKRSPGAAAEFFLANFDAIQKAKQARA